MLIDRATNLQTFVLSLWRRLLNVIVIVIVVEFLLPGAV